jgi:uncharacterized protein (TIGR02246 family)
MKKLLMVIPLVFLLCFTFSCQQGEEVAEEPVVDVEADVEADKEAIKKITDDFNAAINAGNIDKLVSLYTDDAVRIPPNKPALVGKEAIRSLFQEQLDQFTVQNEGVIVDLKVSGDLAFVRGSWTSINTPKTGGEPLKFNGNFVSIIQKQPDGSWKTICNSWSNEQLILPPIEK